MRTPARLGPPPPRSLGPLRSGAMRILGHGIDLMDLAKVRKHLSDPHDDWLDGAFSDDERAQADPPPHEIEFYGGRYAAKEAVVKALGTGFSDDVAWLDVEILRRPAGS